MLKYRHSRGISLVELMVGIAVGMIVVAGASVMLVNQVNEHRRLMLETQVQQDLRASADLILRELRRAGYRGIKQEGVWTPSTPAAAASYSVTTPTVTTPISTLVTYRYSKDAVDTAADVFDENTEQFGFRRIANVLQFRLGSGGWQPLTDPGTVLITNFNVALVVQTVDMADYCEVPCAAGATACPPQQEVLNFDITLTGTATHDPAVVRTLNVSTRVRNDRIIGTCPA